jgi:hypothetical protein
VVYPVLEENEKNLVLMERGFGLVNQEPASIAALWDMILNQDVPSIFISKLQSLWWTAGSGVKLQETS